MNILRNNDACFGTRAAKIGAVLASFMIGICAVGYGDSTVAMAAAQEPWVLPPAPVSLAGQDAIDSRIAVSKTGAVTAVWTRNDINGNSIVQTSTRLAGGSWSVPENLSAPGQDARNPKIVVAQNGTTTVVWSRSNGTHFIVQASTRAPDGAFPQPQAVAQLSQDGQNSEFPDIAVAKDGTTTVVWNRLGSSDNIIQTVTRRPGESFPPPAYALNLSATGEDSYEPDIATGGDGRTTIVWYRLDSNNHAIVQAATRPNGGSFQLNASALSAGGQSAASPRVDIGDDGTTAVVWSRNNGTYDIIQAALRLPNGSFPNPGQATDLSADSNSARDPQVAVGPNGETTVVWYQFDASNDTIIQSSTRPANGTFPSFATSLSAEGQSAEHPQVDVSDDGTTTAVWARANGASNIIQAATRSPNGSFPAPGQAVNLSSESHGSYRPQIATAPSGVATAVWQRFDGMNTVVEAASTKLPTYQLLAERQGNGKGLIKSSPSGINCGTDCSGTFAHGTEVTLTADAGSGSRFAGWGGACAHADTARTCRISIDQARSVKATFALSGPTSTTALFDGRRLYIDLPCPGKFKPYCLSKAAPITNKKTKRVKGKKVSIGKELSTARNLKIASGKHKELQFLVKPAYRSKINKLIKSGKRSLYVKQTIRSKKVGKKAGKGPKLVFHAYKVRRK